MALVCPNSGELLLLQYIVGKLNADNPVLHLYSNNTLTPSDSTTIGDITEVSPTTGYTPITLLSSAWSVSQDAGVSYATHAQVTFVFSTTATAYGYYVTNETGSLLWMEGFPSAFNIPSGGGTISINPKLALD